MVVRLFDSHHRLLGRRVVADACVARCQPALYTVRIPFSIAGLQQGYVEISPLNRRSIQPGQVVEIPVALNGG